MARGGLSNDPEIRRRQEEGLARGRAIAAERRKAGLPSKRKERELEQRVIEGGRRGGSSQRQTEKETSRGATASKTRQREQPAERRDADEAGGVRLPRWAPFYTGRSNTDFLAGLVEDDAGETGDGS